MDVLVREWNRALKQHAMYGAGTPWQQVNKNGSFSTILPFLLRTNCSDSTRLALRKQLQANNNEQEVKQAQSLTFKLHWAMMIPYKLK